MKTQTIASTLLVVMLITAFSCFAVCNAAQPLSDWTEVTSPQNNYIYPSGDVWLKFTPQKGLDVNYSSYSINLDGQMQNIGGNQSFYLQNLSAGSHKLAIYGNVSTGYFANQTELLSIVYFNVYYSSNWVTFILSLSIFVALASLVLFVSRRRLITRLKGKKNGYFWLGSVMAILASLLIVPLGWRTLNDYLFPYYNYLGIQVSPVPFVIGGLVVLCVGIVFMGFGTMQQESGTRKQ